MDEEQKVAAKPKGSKMMIVIIGLLVLLIGVIVAAFFFIMNSVNNAQTANIVQIELPSTTVNEVTFIETGGAVNTNLLVGTDGRDRRIVFSFDIGVNNTHEDAEELISLLTHARPVIRNIALSVARDLTFNEVNDRGGATVLTDEILRRLQDEFTTNLIVRIELTEFMAQ